MLPVPSYSQTIPCPSCGSQVPANSNYCNICGTQLRQPVLLKICPRCQSRIVARSRFCPECGLKQPDLCAGEGEQRKAPRRKPKANG